MKIQTIVISESENISLDCYLHEDMFTVNSRPAVIICPGGGYIMLTEDEGSPVAIGFFSRGFQAFVLKYPIQEHAWFPNPHIAAAKAISLVRSKAELWKIDPDKIAIGGFSAGGHVALTAGCMWNHTALLDAANAIGVSGRPDAMFGIYPVTGTYMKQGQNENITAVSCMDAVDETTPPAFLAHTYEDTLIPTEQSLMLAYQLACHRIPFECHVYEQGNHGALNSAIDIEDEHGGIQPNRKSWFYDCCRWLQDLFGGSMKQCRKQPAGEFNQIRPVLPPEKNVIPAYASLSQPLGNQLLPNTSLRSVLQYPDVSEYLLHRIPELQRADLSGSLGDTPLFIWLGGLPDGLMVETKKINQMIFSN